jgi:hypothetical protein
MYVLLEHIGGAVFSHYKAFGKEIVLKALGRYVCIYIHIFVYEYIIYRYIHTHIFIFTYMYVALGRYVMIFIVYIPIHFITKATTNQQYCHTSLANTYFPCGEYVLSVRKRPQKVTFFYGGRNVNVCTTFWVRATMGTCHWHVPTKSFKH